MITDIGVRTLLNETYKMGYSLEQKGKYLMALRQYGHALQIAKSFDDEGEIAKCNNRIAMVKNKINKKEIEK